MLRDSWNEAFLRRFTINEFEGSYSFYWTSFNLLSEGEILRHDALPAGSDTESGKAKYGKPGEDRSELN